MAYHGLPDWHPVLILECVLSCLHLKLTLRHFAFIWRNFGLIGRESVPRTLKRQDIFKNPHTSMLKLWVWYIILQKSKFVSSNFFKHTKKWTPMQCMHREWTFEMKAFLQFWQQEKHQITIITYRDSAKTSCNLI